MANFAWTSATDSSGAALRAKAEMAAISCGRGQAKVLENLIKPFWNARSPKGGK